MQCQLPCTGYAHKKQWLAPVETLILQRLNLFSTEIAFKVVNTAIVWLFILN